MGKMKFNKANEWTKEIGDLKFVMEFQVVAGYTSTCSALQYLAEMEESINKEQRDHTNYAPVTDKLLDVFDTYIRERYKKQRKTSDRRNFKPNNLNDLTLCLAWQLRNVLNHEGGVIDNRCSNNYMRILSNIQDADILEDLCFPLMVKSGEKIEIDYDTYCIIKKAFYDYLDRKKHTPEEMRTFRARGSIVMKNLDGDIVINMGSFLLKLRISDIHSIGGRIDFDTMFPIFPCNARFNPKTDLIELENGKSIKAIPMPLPF